MAFFTVSREANAVKDFSGNSLKTGMYDIRVKHVIVTQSTSSQATGIDLVAEILDENTGAVRMEQRFYGIAWLTNKEGVENESGRNFFNKFVIVASNNKADEISDPVDRQITTGRDKKIENVVVLEDFDDIELTIRIQMEHSDNDGKLRTRPVIRNFFRIGDHATADEIVNNKEPGKQYERELALGSKDSYRDNLDEQQVKDAQANSGVLNKAAAAASAAPERKRFGARK